MGLGWCFYRFFFFFSLLVFYDFYTLRCTAPYIHNVSHNNRIVSFCHANDLKRMEVVCKQTNNSEEVQDIVEAIRQGLDGTNSIDEIAEIRAALTHLCNMTVNLKHQADVSARLCSSVKKICASSLV